MGSCYEARKPKETHSRKTLFSDNIIVEAFMKKKELKPFINGIKVLLRIKLDAKKRPTGTIKNPQTIYMFQKEMIIPIAPFPGLIIEKYYARQNRQTVVRNSLQQIFVGGLPYD
jgi:hypothetical protein